MQAFRDALERSRSALESNVTLPRDRVQEVVDDAVKRGRMTRGDANELVSNLVSRSRKATDDLIRDLEKLLEQARKEVDTRTSKARKELETPAPRPASRRPAPPSASAAPPATPPTGRSPRPTSCAAAPALRARRSPATTSSPRPQVKSRLKDLTKADLRKVRTQEKRGKARKGILDAIEKQLA